MTSDKFSPSDGRAAEIAARVEAFVRTVVVSYERDPRGDRVHLVLGPWNHAQGGGEGRGIGPILFEGDTAGWFRRTVMQPFLDYYLKDGPKPDIPRVLAYETGADKWRQYDDWPRACASDCALPLVYVSEPLNAPLHVAGIPVADLFASTSGSDADWVVKIIDVWPDEVPNAPVLGGYQQMLSAAIFRGRYREGFTVAHPIPAR